MPITGMEARNRIMLNTPFASNVENSYTAVFASDSTILTFVDPLPRIPAMAATALHLELLLQEPLVDLKAVSAVILSDAGATLQILRLASEEFPHVNDRPLRIEDCLASLNSDCWYSAIRQQGAPLDAGVVKEWQGCRRVGAWARELAAGFDNLAPNEAYIVGLLHRLGGFPHLLGWTDVGETAAEHHALGLMLADFWQLPPYLAGAIREMQTPGAPVRWRELLHQATQLAAVQDQRWTSASFS